MGETPYIVPENICHDVIERVLNPVAYDGFYTDKNNFDCIFPKGVMPRTIMRKIHGCYYDADYRRLILDEEKLRCFLDSMGVDSIVIKPTVDGISGRGVTLVNKNNSIWVVLGTDNCLSLQWLDKECGDDIIIQECLTQSDFTAQFNSTSVNTIRLTTYRSVKTGECHVTSGVFRIGGKGRMVDNAHAGGGYVRLHEVGSLGNQVLDQFGNSLRVFNDIDFSNNYTIPGFDKVIAFAKEVADCVHHHRLLALDIMLDKDGNPRLIESNSGACNAFSVWLFQFTGQRVFGDYLDEIIIYCAEHLDSAKQQLII